MTSPTNRTACSVLAALLSLALLFVAAASASAAPVLQVDSVSPSTVPSTVHADVETLLQGSSAPARNEVQRLTIAAAAGSYRLSFAGDTTTDIGVLPHPALAPGELCYCYFESAPFDSRFDLQQHLEALPSIGSGNVEVALGGPAGPSGNRPFQIEFTGALAATDVDQITVETGSHPLSPGVTYIVQIVSVGDQPTDGTPIHVTADLPAGFTAVAAVAAGLDGLECPSVVGQSTIVCSTTEVLPRLNAGVRRRIALTATLDPAGGSIGTATFTVSGGGAATAVTADPVTIAPTPPGFGVDAFDAPVLQEGGAAFTQAAGHPDSAAANIDFRVAESDPGLLSINGPFPGPAEHFKDAIVDLPPGLLGNPAAAPRCSLADLAAAVDVFGGTDCSSESQVGTLSLGMYGSPAFPAISVFNLPPPPGSPARFGFSFLGTVVVLDAFVRSGSDYGVIIGSLNTPQALSVYRTQFKIWGDPASPAHDSERACPGERNPFLVAPVCASSDPEVPFLRYPTSCNGPLTTHLSADSWFHPNDVVERTFTSHTGTGYPFPEEEWGPPQGPTGCEKVRFNPTVDAAPTTNVADSPSGLDFHLSVPQDCWEHPEEICQSDLRDAEVTLPRGMSINPAAATGLGACTGQQIGYRPGTEGPFEFTGDSASCPDDSKIGTVEIASPLLARFAGTEPVRDPSGGVVPDPLRGAVYLAAQNDNPTDSLLGFYLVAEGSGIVVKQFGEIRTGPDGRLTTVFRDAPEQPFSDLRVSLFGGPRAPLRTPPACGSFGVTAKLTPWSGTGTVTRGSTFEIESCPRSGFDPALTAGADNPLAGAYSPFRLRLTREDGTDPIAGLQVKLPHGLLANLGSVSHCPDSALNSIPKDAEGQPVPGTGATQIASPSCPAASQVGTVTVGAGAGPTPFYTDLGRVYWAGPYKGAPVSLAAVVPAVAGPFDLGTQVVRNGIYVDPDTAELTVKADPLPTILHGIPLDLRDVRVDVTRPNYTLNPTSCDPMAVDGLLSSPTGTTTARSSRFQVGGCDRLGFKPKLSFRFKGAVHRRAHPSLTAVYRARPGDANLARAQVKLPPAAFLDNAHIGTICTRVQFAAHACPEGSIYGRAQATSPILPYAVAGPVYLRSSSNKLPDLVADLRGPDTQPIEVALAGRTDSVKGALRNTFELVPDAPVTEFRLTLFGKSKGLIIMSSGFCANPRATVKLDAHNGKLRDTNPIVRSKCSGDKKRRK